MSSAVARAPGMVAADQTTVDYLRGRRYVPTGKDFERARGALAYVSQRRRRALRSQAWCSMALHSRRKLTGHESRDVTDISGRVRIPTRSTTNQQRDPSSARFIIWRSNRAQGIEDFQIDSVFIGSCTNSRISDLTGGGGRREGAGTWADSVHAMVVPGSQK